MAADTYLAHPANPCLRVSVCVCDLAMGKVRGGHIPHCKGDILPIKRVRSGRRKKSRADGEEELKILINDWMEYWILCCLRTVPPDSLTFIISFGLPPRPCGKRWSASALYWFLISLVFCGVFPPYSLPPAVKACSMISRTIAISWCALATTHNAAGKNVGLCRQICNLSVCLMQRSTGPGN